jgi:hypothetical protein
VYGAAQEANKNEFLAELAIFRNQIIDPFLVGGNFHIITFASEKNKGGGVHRHADLLNSIINSLGMIDFTC